MTPACPHLPPELITLIIDCVADDLKDLPTLQSVALLSRAYLGHARKRLFATITLRLRGAPPNPVGIRDVVRRIQGLCEFLKPKHYLIGDDEADELTLESLSPSRYIRTLVILDSYPVYESQWITQQACLPPFLDSLHHVRDVTFGCEVGYLQWRLFTAELKGSIRRLLGRPSVRKLKLCELGSVPVDMLTRRRGVRYLELNNVATAQELEPQINRKEVVLARSPTGLRYLNVRTVSLLNTASLWAVMEAHARTLEFVRWRCWEDAPDYISFHFPALIDLSQLPALRKLTVRLSYGKLGKDLLGFASLLDLECSGTRQGVKSEIRVLEIAILFPHHSNPHEASELRRHLFWERLPNILSGAGSGKGAYGALRRVSLELTVREKVVVRVRDNAGAVAGTHVDMQRTLVNSVLEFRKQMKVTLRPLLNLPTLHFKLKVRGFP